MTAAVSAGRDLRAALGARRASLQHDKRRDQWIAPGAGADLRAGPDRPGDPQTLRRRSVGGRRSSTTLRQSLQRATRGHPQGCDWSCFCRISPTRAWWLHEHGLVRDYAKWRSFPSSRRWRSWPSSPTAVRCSAPTAPTPLALDRTKAWSSTARLGCSVIDQIGRAGRPADPLFRRRADGAQGPRAVLIARGPRRRVSTPT